MQVKFLFRFRCISHSESSSASRAQRCWQKHHAVKKKKPCTVLVWLVPEAGPRSSVQTFQRRHFNIRDVSIPSLPLRLNRFRSGDSKRAGIFSSKLKYSQRGPRPGALDTRRARSFLPLPSLKGGVPMRDNYSSPQRQIKQKATRRSGPALNDPCNDLNSLYSPPLGRRWALAFSIVIGVSSDA